jgi:peptidoglycan hydrolase-like protein with peptidoglycan-binding domain
VRLGKNKPRWRRWSLRLGAAAVTSCALAGGLATVASAAPVQPAKPAAAGYTPASRTLKMGMKGSDIKRLQQRLASLGYYPGSADGSFGMDTEEAVWAFQEVQGLHASGEITWPVEKALVNPKAPKRLVPNGGSTRVEVSLGRHVLYVYCSDGSCAYAHTPTGNFKTTWRAKGWETSPLGELYNPVFFYEGYAVHGDTYVPLNPVSHGCVRIPMDVANIYPGLVPTSGIPVYVRANG